MLSVLHVMTRMQASGTELQLAGTLRAARGRHWDPVLCVLHDGFALTGQVAADGVDVVELHARSHADRMLALRRLARSGRFDVVHTSLWGAGAFGRAALTGPGRPAVVMSERRVEDFRGRGRRAVDDLLRLQTDAWIGNSQDVCDFVVRAHHAPRDRVFMVRNGIDTDVFRPPAADEPRGSRTGAARIGAVGRLVEQKGFDVLLEALPAVLAKCDVEVVVVGEGELRADLERRAAGLPVSFPGALDGPSAVAGFLRGLDLFVLPSRYEGLPNALLEAQACGLSVVATDVPGVREAAGDSVTLVPSQDPAALALAVVEALDRPPPVRAPPARSFDDVAGEHREVFERAVRHRARTTRT